MLNDFDAVLDARREELVALCARLVAQRSANPPGDATGVAAVVKEFLEAEGLRPEIVAASPEAPNVVATVAGAWPGPT